MNTLVILSTQSSVESVEVIFKFIAITLPIIAVVYFIWRYNDRNKKKNDRLSNLESKLGTIQRDVEEVKKKEVTEKHGDRIIVLETDSKSLKATVSRMEKHFETIVAMLHEMKGELKNKP